MFLVECLESVNNNFPDYNGLLEYSIKAIHKLLSTEDFKNLLNTYFIIIFKNKKTSHFQTTGFLYKVFYFKSIFSLLF